MPYKNADIAYKYTTAHCHVHLMYAVISFLFKMSKNTEQILSSDWFEVLADIWLLHHYFYSFVKETNNVIVNIIKFV